MRYSFVTTDVRPVARATRALQDAIQMGVGVDRASERLQVAEKIEGARRATQQTLRVVKHTLVGVAPKWNAWESFVAQVEGFRK